MIKKTSNLHNASILDYNNEFQGEMYLIVKKIVTKKKKKKVSWS